MAEMREERKLLKCGREEGRGGNMGIWQKGGKREEYGFMEKRREDRGIWEKGR